MLVRAFLLGSVLTTAANALGCDLCAIYNADSAAGRSASGFSIGVSEQFIPYRTVQRDGVPLPPSIYDLAYVDRAMPPLAPTWNISPRFGVSLSLPVIYE